MICSICGTNNNPGARFCVGCRKQLIASSADERTVVHPISAAARTQLSAIMPAGTHAMDHSHAVTRMTLACAGKPEEITFVLDVSGSMEEYFNATRTKLEAAVRAASAAILQKARTNPHARVAIVTFDDEASIALPLCCLATDKMRAIEVFKRLTAGGGTDINEGLLVARDTFDWSQGSVDRRVKLLTDGQGGRPLNTAKELKNRGVIIDVTGVGDSPENVDEPLLRQVASTANNELLYRFVKDEATLIEATRL